MNGMDLWVGVVMWRTVAPCGCSVCTFSWPDFERNVAGWTGHPKWMWAFSCPQFLSFLCLQSLQSFHEALLAQNICSEIEVTKGALLHKCSSWSFASWAQNLALQGDSILPLRLVTKVVPKKTAWWANRNHQVESESYGKSPFSSSIGSWDVGFGVVEKVLKHGLAARCESSFTSLATQSTQTYFTSCVTSCWVPWIQRFMIKLEKREWTQWILQKLTERSSLFSERNSAHLHWTKKHSALQNVQGTSRDKRVTLQQHTHTHNQQIQLSLALGRCQGLDFFLKNLWLNNHWVTACVCASFSRGCLQLEVADWKRFNTIPSTNRCVASAQVRFFHLPWCSWDCCSYFLRSNKAGSDNHVLLKATGLKISYPFFRRNSWKTGCTMNLQSQLVSMLHFPQAGAQSRVSGLCSLVVACHESLPTRAVSAIEADRPYRPQADHSSENILEHTVVCFCHGIGKCS